MDVQDELGGGHHHDHTHVIKGKRTKRQRSPLVAAATAASTSSSTGGIGGGAAVSEDYNSAVSSPATTAISSAPASTDCTEEEEDMAICLIMLANGGGLPLDLRNAGKREKIQKSSERFQTENSNFYGCKTCNRTFPSFQALGGHRASHKKPRTSGDEKTKLPLTTALKLNSSEEGKNCPPTTKISAVLAVTTSQTSNTTNNNKSSKIHECSICGSEFTSGQALGGHMRRHRVATAALATGESTNSPMGLISSGNTEETENVDRPIEPRKFLPLDLNLPAPEDDLRESKFQGLVFSATPALVDCHY